MNKKGFTLVELLAVIAILAILVLIALPNIVNMFTEAKKRTFVTEAQTVYNETVKKYINSSMKGEKLTTISSKDSSKLDMTGEDLDYCIILDSQGKVEKLAVGNNSYYLMLNDVNNVNSITKEKVQEGKLKDMKCDASAFKVKIDCKFDGNLKQGAEYVNGQYTYKYKQQGKGTSKWGNISSDGWGVILTDKSNTNPVTTDLCTTINDKPIVSMSYMFYGSKATEIKGLEKFNTSNVIDMNCMFNGSQAITLDLSSFDTSNVIDMSSMFYGSKATTLDLSNFDTSNVTDMGSMFFNSRATEIKGLEKFNTSNVTDMSHIFTNLPATVLDLSHFNTSNVTDMTSMFTGSQVTMLDLSSFDTGKVTSMSNMFRNSNVTEIKGLEKFNTGNVTDMSYMFNNVKISLLDVSNFDTSKVTNMAYMFSGSQAITLDLSNFDTSNVTDMSNMFHFSKAITGYARTQADADKFNASSYKPSSLIFVVK